MVAKERLDILLAEKGLCASREQAQRCILAGEVWQGQVRLEKPGLRVAVDAPIEVRSRLPKFVSRGGFKLEHALEVFQISVQERVCLDIGASTGGFTDCLLQRGAARVLAVDVGTGQIDSKLRTHAQVTSLEQCNVRHMTADTLSAVDPRAGEISFVCADVSFISLKLLIEAIARSAPAARDWVLLFKPQFEVGPEHVGRGGRVTNQQAIARALEDFDTWMKHHGFFRPGPVLDSPVAGKKSGNLEILLHYVRPR